MKFKTMLAIAGFVLASFGVGSKESLAQTASYAFYPPNKPTSTSQIVVWNSGSGSLPPGSSDKYLLVTIPSPSESIRVTGTGLRWKGIFLIGFEAKSGTTLSTPPAGLPKKKGGQILEFGFSNQITHRPFVFIANGLFDAGTGSDRTWWGDFLGAYTAKGNEDLSLPQSWNNAVDIYLQKILVPNGHYGWSDTDLSDQNIPHSDFVQNKGKWFRFCGSKLDVRWGYQTLLTKGTNTTGDAGPPNGVGVARVKDSVFRFMPSDTTVYPSPGYPPASYKLMLVSDTDTSKAYQGILDNVYFVKSNHPDNLANPANFFSPKTGISATVSGDINFPGTYIPGSSNPIWQKYNVVRQVNTDAAAPTVVNSTSVGNSIAITTEQDLLDVVSNWPTSPTCNDN